MLPKSTEPVAQERVLLTYPNRETICLYKSFLDQNGFRFDPTEEALNRVFRSGQAVRVTPNDMLRYVTRVDNFTVVEGTMQFPLPQRCAIVTDHLDPPH